MISQFVAVQTRLDSSRTGSSGLEDLSDSVSIEFSSKTDENTKDAIFADFKFFQPNLEYLPCDDSSSEYYPRCMPILVL